MTPHPVPVAGRMSTLIPKRGTHFYDDGQLACVVDASSEVVHYGPTSLESSVVCGSRSCTPAEFVERFGSWLFPSDYRAVQTPRPVLVTPLTQPSG